MALITVWLKIDEEHVVQSLREAGEKLNAAEGEVLLDFASVRRTGPSALNAMEKFVNAADDKAVTVVLREVNVDVYKVLKLMKLAHRFSYVN